MTKDKQQMTNLTPKELERYSRQIQLTGFGESGQKALKNTTALVSGVGGLGGTVALYLAVAGIGKLILVRGGELRLDDMNRQILMTDDWVGKPRVTKAKETLTQINPDVEVEAIEEHSFPTDALPISPLIMQILSSNVPILLSVALTIFPNEIYSMLPVCVGKSRW